jgi:transcriptional regulator with XRE-family HTH domain
MSHNMQSQSQRIAYAIKESNLKQADLVRATGATRSAVSQWINGQIIKIGAEHIFAIADATHFNARWLATGEGEERPSGDTRINALLDLYGQLDERGRQAVLRVAESESSYTTGDQLKVSNGDC